MAIKHLATVGTMKSNPDFAAPEWVGRSVVKHRFSIYKTALFVNDLLLSILIFAGCALIFAEDIDLFGNYSHLLTLVILALASVAFFKTCALYNYHVIYDAKKHIKQIAKAWGWNAFILVCVFFIYTANQYSGNVQFFLITAAIAVLFSLLRKYFEDLSIQTLKAVGMSFIIVGLLGFIEGEAIVAVHQAPLALLYGFGLTTVSVSLSRYLIVHQLFGRVLRTRFRRQTLIIGSDDQAEQITRYVIENNAPFWISGFLGRDSAFGKDLSVRKNHLGGIASLPQVVEAIGINEVIITDETIDKKTLIGILDYCASMRINIWFPPHYMPVISVKLRIDHFCDLPMIRLGTQKNIWLFNKLKYSFDALAALPIFLLQLPIFSVIAAAIKITSPGPVFYRATAIGKGGEPFTMYKFRSMRQDADSTVHQQYVTRLIKGQIKPDGDNPKVLKITSDNRITPVGRMIRKFSLDELPQLINVLKGDMSLIGPRPCLPYEYAVYEEWHKKRVAIRPGITGLWQVTGRSEVAFDDMILLDLYYLYNRCFSLDLSILMETAFVVLKKKGAY